MKVRLNHRVIKSEGERMKERYGKQTREWTKDRVTEWQVDLMIVRANDRKTE